MRMPEHEELAERLNGNPDFASSGKFFDGIVLLRIGDRSLWIKVFMGEAIRVSEEAFPFGFTFAVSGDPEGWRFALPGDRNRFREALYSKRLQVEGNTLEFSRMTRMMHGLTEVLRKKISDGRMSLED